MVVNLSSTEMATKEPYERPFGETVVWITGVLIFMMLVVGIILNTITVIVIWKYKALRNLFVYFIFSLCLSDLLSALISPLFWYRRTLGFDEWIFPDFFCKFYWAADLMTNFVTTMHIAAFGVFRLISIKYPHYFTTISNKVGIICCTVIWLICFGCGFVPYFIWFGAREKDRYSDAPDARWPACTINMEWYEQYTLFQKTGYALFLLTPLIFVVIISIMTIFQVYVAFNTSSKPKSDRLKRKEKQAVLQLILIVISFLVGYVPFAAYELWSTQDHGSSRYIKVLDWHFGMFEYHFLRLSECMNPIFYNLGSTKMRKRTRMFLNGLVGRNSTSQSRPASNTSIATSEPGVPFT